MPTIILDMGVDHPKTEAEMAYLENKITGEAIHHKLRNKVVHETNMHKI